MDVFFQKPHLISWLTIPILGLIGLLFQHHTLTIQLYDTYYLMGNVYLVPVGALLLLVIGIGYWFLTRNGQKLTGVLTAIHLVPTIAGLFLLTLPFFSDDNLANLRWFSLLAIAFLAAQCVYVVVILFTLLRK